MKNNISATTEKLWNEVVKKYGNDSYRLAVNGRGDVILTAGYTREIAKGNRNTQKALRDLLKA